MKRPRTVIVDHLNAGKPMKTGLFGRTVICDYDSPEGIVRETHRWGRKVPEYKLLRTGERVMIEFSQSISSEIDGYGYYLDD